MPWKDKEKQRAYQKKQNQELKEYKRIWLNNKRAQTGKYRTTKAQNLKYFYGITLEQYDELLFTQGKVCAICKEPQGTRMLAVDHDHETGRVRGLLCMGCNTGLGSFKDNVLMLQSAVNYLINSFIKLGQEKGSL